MSFNSWGANIPAMIPEDIRRIIWIVSHNDLSVQTVLFKYNYTIGIGKNSQLNIKPIDSAAQKNSRPKLI